MIIYPSILKLVEIKQKILIGQIFFLFLGKVSEKNKAVGGKIKR